ncbi:MAG: ThiF family adenylyltransferase [Thermoanaerobaculia bacterium]
MTSRHSRHLLFDRIGEEGQRRIAAARIAIVGCGALGSRAAELLARAGAGTGDGGFLRLIDRDYVDVSNLQRQALYDTDDARAARPKATAAARHLAAIDPAVRCEALVRDLTPANASTLLAGAGLVVDGTDNFRTRFLLNDAALAMGVPWIHGGAVASRGVVAAFAPGHGPCFRCLLDHAPGLGAGETCDTAGVVTTVPALVATLQATFALRWLVDGTMPRGLRLFDLWDDEPRWKTLFTGAAADPECRSCGRRELPALRDEGREVVTLCGRNSVQIIGDETADLASAAARLDSVATEVHRHPESITARFPEGALTLFADGRVIVEGTTDPMEATTLVARYLGG